MADSQVEEVKRKTDIVAVISERVKLAKAGRNFKGLCPFHSEKTASFMVSPELGIYKCFGCGKSGDVISFLEEFEGMEFPEALKYLADRAGVRLEQVTRDKKQVTIKERLVEINHLTAEFYHFLLTQHRVGDRARTYLKERGVSSEAVEVFRLGYAPESWEGLQKFLVGKKGYKPEEVEAAGLIIKSDKYTSAQGHKYYDRFRGRIVFALTDARGKVMGFAGRLLDAEVKEAKYVNTPETAIYHKSELLYGLSVTRGEIKKADMAVVVEGELDATASWQAQVKNVVAIKGSAFTEKQIRLLGRYTKNVRLALDADAAGQEATRRSISLADSLGMNVRVVELEGGKDPDEIARGEAREWREMVKQAIGVYDWYIKSTLRRFEVKTGEGKRLASGELAPILAGIGNRVEQAHYVKLVAEKLGVAEEAVGEEVRKAKGGIRVEVEPSFARLSRATEGTGSRRERLEEYWLGLVLRLGGDARVSALDWAKDREWEVGVVGKVVKQLRRWKKEVGVRQLVAALPAELKEVVERVWLAEIGEEEEGGKLEIEMKRTERELQKLTIQAKLKRLGEKIKELEKGGKGGGAALVAEFVAWAKKLAAI